MFTFTVKKLITEKIKFIVKGHIQKHFMYSMTVSKKSLNININNNKNVEEKM